MVDGLVKSALDFMDPAFTSNMEDQLDAVEAGKEERVELLGRFYKHDEAFAFDLWASPRKQPKVMVLYFEARPWSAPIWVAVTRGGVEITDPKKLPRGAFVAMKHAADD